MRERRRGEGVGGGFATALPSTRGIAGARAGMGPQRQTPGNLALLEH